MGARGGRLNLRAAPRRDRTVPQIFTVASFGVFIFGRIQPFSGHKALFLMGFLPFCVKPLAPLALEAVGTVGTVGTSNGKPVRARLSKGLCCSHSQFTKWEQWEHPSLCQPLLPCLPTTAQKAPRARSPRSVSCLHHACPCQTRRRKRPRRPTFRPRWRPIRPAPVASTSPGCCTAHGGRLAACTGGPSAGRGWI